MAKIFNSVDELIGKTPLLRLNNIEKDCGAGAEILAKLERMNPAGSVKDRVAKNMLDEAERTGKITKNTVIIEPTSGNTGIGLCAVCASRGYKVIIVMPESMSAERRKLMTAYGAELVLTPAAEGMKGSIEKARQLAAQTKDSFITGQFTNPANPQAHYLTTGPEIWEATDGGITYFIAGVGTGGTITGVGKYLKEKNPAVKIIAVEPASSPLLSGGTAGAHGLQGIGANFIPDILDRDIYDEIITVTDTEAYEAGREAARHEGILVGITSGAALHAAKLVSKRPEAKGGVIVALMPDTGERYLSTPMFS